MTDPFYGKTVDPMRLAEICWPHVTFYQQQQEIIYSVWDNVETYVPAGNMLGKDFVGGFIAVAFFLTRHPVRIVTTSAKDDHLRVLWGEIGQFLATSKVPLTSDKGGPIILNHQSMKKKVNGETCPLSYCIGMVANDASIAAMQGHHVANVGDGIPRTLFMTDESSSVPQAYYNMGTTWRNRLLSIGNTWPCENAFKWALKGRPGTDDLGGDLLKPDGRSYDRKVIRIRAEDSPNVRLGMAQVAAGLEPTDEIVVKGVKSYGEYLTNRRMMDPHQQCVSLDADFYEGAEVKLFPKEWLLNAQSVALQLRAKKVKRQAIAIGIDPAEGGDQTAMCAVDQYGLLDLETRKTPDTNDIIKYALAFMQKHNVNPKNVYFDRGGGGKQHADRLRASGYPVRTVSFGTIKNDPRAGQPGVRTRIDDQESQYAYMSRRVQMYAELSHLLDPSMNPKGFAISNRFPDIHRQLAPIPKDYDKEGRLTLPPKNQPAGAKTKVVTLVALIGHSPDEADALVVAVHAMLNLKRRPKAGASF